MTGRQDAENTDIWPRLESGIKTTCKPKIHSKTHNIQPTLNGLKRGDAGEVILNLFFSKIVRYKEVCQYNFNHAG